MCEFCEMHILTVQKLVLAILLVDLILADIAPCTLYLLYGIITFMTNLCKVMWLSLFL